MCDMSVMVLGCVRMSDVDMRMCVKMRCCVMISMCDVEVMSDVG